MRTTQAMVHHPSVIHSIIHFACWPCNSKYAERVNCTAKFTAPCHVRGMRLLNTIKLKNIYVPMRAGGTFTAQATKRLRNQPDYSSRINWAVSVTKQRKTCLPRTIFVLFRVPVCCLHSISNRKSQGYSSSTQISVHQPLLSLLSLPLVTKSMYSPVPSTCGSFFPSIVFDRPFSPATFIIRFR